MDFKQQPRARFAVRRLIHYLNVQGSEELSRLDAPEMSKNLHPAPIFFPLVETTPDCRVPEIENDKMKDTDKSVNKK
ncbi:MAG: hypothetical protein DME46_12320 [Verrucomicrobia bacterium]|nr:MAG: hypothetical protein DME46_12320 [Verrucomicrobiota bacterium]